MRGDDSVHVRRSLTYSAQVPGDLVMQSRRRTLRANLSTLKMSVVSLGAGDTCFFPADAPHTFIATSEEPVEVLIIYAPPYGEAHARTHDAA